MSPVLRTAFLFAMCLAAHGMTHASASRTATREEVREAIARWWDATDSIDARSVLSIPGNGVERVYRDHHVTIASGGKYLLRSDHLDKNGRRTSISDECTDGLKTYRRTTVPGNPDIADALEVFNSNNTRDTYSGPMNELFWLLMPGGKRLHRQLDDGAQFIVEKGEDGVDRYIVQFDFRFKSNPVRCELDPDHDWLPRAIDVGESGDALRIRVAKFTEEGGRFFPSEGNVAGRDVRDGKGEARFIVRSARINQNLPPELFKPPGLVTGTVIFDHQKGVQSIHGGGIKARQDFETRYLPLKSAGTSTTEEPAPLRAERPPPEWPVVPTLAASTLLLVASLLVYRRRNRDDM